MVELRTRGEVSEIAGQRVDIPTSQGTTLRGKFVRPSEIFGERPPAVLLTHGAAANFDPLPFFHQLQTDLQDAGFASLAVNLSGVGDSTGNYFEQSINKRVGDVRDAWHFLQRQNVDTERMALLTGSLNGHVAAKLTKSINIPALVLYEPAAYLNEAEGVYFGPVFSEVIRSPQNPLSESPVFEDYLASYKGNLFVTFGTSDPVIPAYVRVAYFNLADEYLSLGEINHALLGNPKLDAPGSVFRQSLYKSTISFLERSLLPKK